MSVSIYCEDETAVIVTVAAGLVKLPIGTPVHAASDSAALWWNASGAYWTLTLVGATSEDVSRVHALLENRAAPMSRSSTASGRVRSHPGGSVRNSLCVIDDECKRSDTATILSLSI